MNIKNEAFGLNTNPEPSTSLGENPQTNPLDAITEDLWTTLDDTTGGPYLSFLLYGPAGVQKTRLACQFPDTLVLACDPRKEGGVLTAKEFHPNYIQITEYTQITNLLPKLKQLAGIKFNTIWIDSISYLHRLIVRGVLKQTSREVATFEEWNLAQERCRTLICALAEFNCNIGFTAVDSIIKDEKTGKIRGLPKMPGQLADELPQAVDVCLRLYRDTGWDAQGEKFINYKMTWVPDDPWVHGKDGTNSLPATMVTTGSSLSHLWKNLPKLKP